MKVNLHWLDSFVDLKVGRDELLQRINTQLGEIESIADFGQKYAGATVVKVVEVSPHPKGDKLSLCLIDDKRQLKDVERQKSGLVQIVCGAANVKAGMLAVWLPPGSIVPNGFSQEAGKRIELAAREIRGVLSQGMLASVFELDLGLEKETILSLDSSSAAKTAVLILIFRTIPSAGLSPKSSILIPKSLKLRTRCSPTDRTASASSASPVKSPPLPAALSEMGGFIPAISKRREIDPSLKGSRQSGIGYSLSQARRPVSGSRRSRGSNSSPG